MYIDGRWQDSKYYDYFVWSKEFLRSEITSEIVLWYYQWSYYHSMLRWVIWSLSTLMMYYRWITEIKGLVIRIKKIKISIIYCMFLCLCLCSYARVHCLLNKFPKLILTSSRPVELIKLIPGRMQKYLHIYLLL